MGLRYIVVETENDSSIGFAKSFQNSNLALACANDRLARAGGSAVFVSDDFKFIDSLGSLTARNNSETIRVTILREDEFSISSRTYQS